MMIGNAIDALGTKVDASLAKAQDVRLDHGR